MSDLMKRAGKWEKFHEPLANSVNTRWAVDQIWRGLDTYLQHQDRQRTQNREDERLTAYKDMARRADEDRDRGYGFQREQFEYGQGRDALADKRQLVADIEHQQDRQRGIRYTEEDRARAEEQRQLANKSAAEHLGMERENLDINRQGLELREGQAMIEGADRRARNQREIEAHDFQMEGAREDRDRLHKSISANAKNVRRILKDPQFAEGVRNSFPAGLDVDTMDDYEIVDAFEQFVAPRLQQEMETQSKIQLEREKGRGKFLEQSFTEEGNAMHDMRGDRARADAVGSAASTYLDESGNLRPEFDADEPVNDPVLKAALGKGYEEAELTYGMIPRAFGEARARLAGAEQGVMALRRSRDQGERFFNGPGALGVNAARGAMDEDERTGPPEASEQPEPGGGPNGANNLPTQNVETYIPRVPPTARERRLSAASSVAGDVERVRRSVHDKSMKYDRSPAQIQELVATGVLSPLEIEAQLGDPGHALNDWSGGFDAAARVRAAAEGARGSYGLGKTPDELDAENHQPRTLLGLVDTAYGRDLKRNRGSNAAARLNKLVMDPDPETQAAISSGDENIIDAAGLLAEQMTEADLERLHPAARRLVEQAQRRAMAQ